MNFPPIVENTHFVLRKMSPKKRTRLFNSLVREHGLFCHWCRRPVVPQHGSGQDTGRQAGNTATLDHVKSRIFGGLDKRENCVIACYRCNQQRSKEDGFLAGLMKFHICAPNRLFGVKISHGVAI